MHLAFNYEIYIFQSEPVCNGRPLEKIFLHPMAQLQSTAEKVGPVRYLAHADSCEP